MAAKNPGRARRRGRRVAVRRLRADDLDALQALYRDLELPEYRPGRSSRVRLRRAFARLNRDRDHRMLIAETNGRVVGAAHVIIVPHLGHGLRPFAVVENVVVDSRARGSGIGSALMREAGKFARSRGCYKISLTTNVNRRGAHKFYQRLGWRRSHFGYSLGLE
jgi:GNAT superfamily N-acetyltransferase